MPFHKVRTSATLIFLNAVFSLTIFLIFKNDLLLLTQGKQQLFIFGSSLMAVVFTYFLVSVFCLTLLCFNTFKVGRIVADLAIPLAVSVVSIFYFVDVQTFSTTGMHLYSAYVIDSLVQENIWNELHFKGNTLISFFLFFGVVITLNYVLYFLFNRLENRFFKYFGRTALVITSVAFMSSVVFFIAFSGKISKDEGNETVPFFDEFHSLLSNDAATRIKKLKPNYPYRTLASVTLSKKPDILFIFVESLRDDIFNDQYMPLTHSFSNRCITSKHHHSGELSTIYSTFSILYGLNIHHYYPFYFSKSRSVPIQILKNNGYLTIGAAASNLKGMSIHSAVLHDQFEMFKEFYDAGWKKDRKMVDWMKELSADKSKDRPKFYFMFFNSTHHNYYYPPEFEKHTPVISQDFNYFDGASLKDRKSEVWNRYLNAAAFIDSLVFETLEHFKSKIEAGEMIIAFAGDHGEEFWDAGALGHGRRSNNFRSQTAFMLCIPETQAKTVGLSSHVDIFPTIIKYLNPTSNLQKWSNGVSLLEDAPSRRYIAVGGFDFPRRSPEVTLISDKGKLLLKKTTDSINPDNKFTVLKRTDLEDKPGNSLANELDWMIDRFAVDMNAFFVQ